MQSMTERSVGQSDPPWVQEVVDEYYADMERRDSLIYSEVVQEVPELADFPGQILLMKDIPDWTQATPEQKLDVIESVRSIVRSRMNQD